MSIEQAITILFNEAKATYFKGSYDVFVVQIIKSYGDYQKNDKLPTLYTIDEWLIEQAKYV